MKILVMDDGMRYRVNSEDNRFYHCDDQSFRKNNPHIVDVLVVMDEEKKSSKKKANKVTEEVIEEETKEEEE